MSEVKEREHSKRSFVFPRLKEQGPAREIVAYVTFDS